MIDDGRLKEILNPGSSLWLGNGTIFSISDIEKTIKDNPEHLGRALPLKSIIDSVSSHRSHTNGAEREFIDGLVEEAAQKIFGYSNIERYGSFSVTAYQKWQAQYAIAKMALVMAQAKAAFSLNGNGIDSITADPDKKMKMTAISILHYNPAQFGIVSSTNPGWPHEKKIALMFGNGSGLKYHLDLTKLFELYFPGSGKRCSHAGGSCASEVESLKSQCYNGSFKDCEIYQNCVDDWK